MRCCWVSLSQHLTTLLYCRASTCRQASGLSGVRQQTDLGDQAAVLPALDFGEVGVGTSVHNHLVHDLVRLQQQTTTQEVQHTRVVCSQ